MRKGKLNKIKWFFVGVVLCAASLSPDLFAAINLNIRNLNVDNMPIIECEIKADNNGVPVVIDSKNVLIQEGFKVCSKYQYELLSDGWYKIKWATERDDYEDSNKTDKDRYLINIFVSSGGETGTAARVILTDENRRVTIHNNVNYNLIEEALVDPRYPLQIRLNAIGNFKDKYMEKVRVDSITFDSPAFSYTFEGNSTDQSIKSLPGLFQPTILYLVNIYFKPTDNKSFRSYMTVHFEGGFKSRLALYAGTFNVERKTVLNLVYPNGKEKLTPCQDIEIKWKGHTQDLPVRVDYSIDGGSTWKYINEVVDSVCNWKIPDLNSENVFIRVTQDFNKTSEKSFVGQPGTILKTAFNSNGSKVISVNEFGEIYEWDVYSSSVPIVINKYYLGAKDQTEYIVSKGLEYIDNDKQIVSANSLYPNPKTSISYFNIGSDVPYKSFDAPDNMSVKRMISDPSKQYLFLIPESGSKIVIMKADDFTEKGKLLFDAPVVDLSFNNVHDTCTVLLLNGDVILLDASKFPLQTEIKRINVPYLPVFTHVTISPDGNLIGLSSVSYNTGKATSNQVVDISRNTIIRTYRPAASETVSINFSPSSTHFIVAAQGQQQLSLFDINQLVQPIYINGHASMLTDMKMAPEGNSILTASGGENKLSIRTFTYPEFDLSDNSFSVTPPVIALTNPVINDAKIGTKNNYTYSVNFCNTGLVPAFLDKAFLANSVHFKVTNKIVPDTLLPGQCLSFDLVYLPVDTGRLADEIIIQGCSKEYKLPLTAISLDRNLSYMESTPLDFGEVCSNTVLEKKIALLRNDDNIDVTINYLSLNNGIDSRYWIKENIKDTVIKPGEILYVTLVFAPNTLGEIKDSVVIYYASQTKVRKFFSVKGTGIGTYLEASHETLLFIPEQPVRKMTIKNTGITPLVVSDIILTPSGFYKNNTILPFTIAPGAIEEIELEYVKENAVPVNLLLNANPCPVQKDIVLDIYKGSSVLTLPTISVDAKDDALIEVKYKNFENGDYKGIREFNSVITCNAKLFYPLSVSSQYGNSEIESNTVENGRRKIKIKTIAEFPLEGTAFVLKGVPGLADVYSTDLSFDPAALYWGSSIDNNLKNGSLTVSGICGDRKIYDNSNLILKSINPNPANVLTNIKFSAEKDCKAKIIIYDLSGNIILSTDFFSVTAGENNLSLNISQLSSGTYKLVVQSDDSKIIGTLTIVR